MLLSVHDFCETAWFVWSACRVCFCSILALLALFKISVMTDVGFRSQNFQVLVPICVKKQDWETDLRHL